MKLSSTRWFLLLQVLEKNRSADEMLFQVGIIFDCSGHNLLKLLRFVFVAWSWGVFQQQTVQVTNTWDNWASSVFSSYDGKHLSDLTHTEILLQKVIFRLSRRMKGLWEFLVFMLLGKHEAWTLFSTEVMSNSAYTSHIKVSEKNEFLPTVVILFSSVSFYLNQYDCKEERKLKHCGNTPKEMLAVQDP